MRITHLLLIAASLITLAGCARTPLVPLEQKLESVFGYASVDAHFCTQAPSPAKSNVKYLFILDHSASNQPGFPVVAGDVTSTDPTGSRRYGPLANFVQNLVPDANHPTSFALIDFNDTAKIAGPQNTFDTSSTHFLNTLNQDWIGSGSANAPAPNDGSFTNYQNALDLAKQMIASDAQTVLNDMTTSYVIIFVTDGTPTVATPSGVQPTYTQTFGADISPAIQKLLNLKNDPKIGVNIAKISLNTVYYYNTTEILSAETLLQQMAALGNGQYQKFASGQNILYQQFVPPSNSIRNQLVDVFVDNAAAVWWDDGRFMRDTDGDGLPDLLEMQMNADPYKADSDGNGVSDLVEYRTKGQPCQDAQCSQANRYPYAVCAGFSPTTDASGRVRFSTTANDGLNDCEKFLLNALPSTFNSNGDLIPDFIGFKNTIAISASSAQNAFMDPFTDGLTNYEKLKQGLPIQVSSRTLGSFQSRHQTLTAELSPSPNVDCYHLQVDHLALASPSDPVRVMIVQNTSTLTDRPFMQQAIHSVDSNSLSVSFSAGDFK